MRPAIRRKPAGLLLLLLSWAFWAYPAAAELGNPPLRGLFLAEELEYGSNPGRLVAWDVASWVGGDYHRIWLESEGDLSTEEPAVDGEAQLLYSRLIASFWELRIGVRGDLVAQPAGRDGRGFLTVGLEGLAPYWFEIEPAVFVSHEGDVSARLRASHDLFVTQRLIAQSRLEVNAALQSVPEFGVGSGPNDLELGLRLRYEWQRELAPYVGLSWRRFFGDTADLVDGAGESKSNLQVLAGLRFWF